jgi:putative membrane protein
MPKNDAADGCACAPSAVASFPRSMDFSILPPINAALNATATLLLIFGRRLARQGQFARHKRVMISAFGVSSLFLLLYVGHKVSRNFENTTYNAEGWAKSAYLVLLGSHVLLAMTVPIFAITLIVLGMKDDRSRHKRFARIGWPIWIYVSVTGVLIYLLLYPLNPAVA